MSVDYYSCDCCGEALYEEFVSNCAKCEVNLCIDCLVDTDGIEEDGSYTYPFSVSVALENENTKQRLVEKYGEESVKRWESWGGINPEYCPYCSGNKVDDSDLLDYLLSKLNLVKEELKDEYLKLQTK